MTREDALFDTLLPGEEGFPSGAEANVGAWLAARAERFSAALADVLKRLPADFPALGADAREAALREIERDAPAAFHALTTGVYSAYYASPAVRTAIEAKTGYFARPPQPDGYALAPFDPALVAVPAGRPPSWRKA